MANEDKAGRASSQTRFAPIPLEAGQSLALLADAMPALLGVVMPCFNEAGTIDEIMRRVLAQTMVAEIIVVDDGSTDGSWTRLLPWATKDHRIRLIHHARNLGKGAALRTGFAVAAAPLLVVQDTDLEYNPADYAALLQPILRGEAEVVYGSRFLNGRPTRSPWWHRAGNRLLTSFSNWVTGLRLTDEATCYKVFPRDLLPGLHLSEDGFGFCPEFTAKLSRQAVRIVEVPIRYQGRSHAQGKKLRLRHGWEALRCLVKYSSSQREPK